MLTDQERVACLRETNRVVGERLEDLDPRTRNQGRRSADQQNAPRALHAAANSLKAGGDQR